MRDTIEHYWRELTTVTRMMPFNQITDAAELLLACHRRGGTVFPLGNGGSASTASHFACDLAKNIRVPGLPSFRVVSLTDNVPLMTAWANDTSYERIFAEQLQSLVRPDDVLVAISASGNSPNVLHAVDAAQAIGATTIALTGLSGGALYHLADLAIRVPSDSIEQVEDAHMAITHSIIVTLRHQLRAQVGLTGAEDELLEVALELGG